MRKPLALVLLLVVCGISTFYARKTQADATPFVVIVNPKNPIQNVDRGFLANAFLKKIKHWPDDGAIQPVDLKPNSHTRREFTETILHRSVSGIKSYWQQLIFSGRDVPPPELANDDEIIQYVLKQPGAIGYVAGTANASGVKKITVR